MKKFNLKKDFLDKNNIDKNKCEFFYKGNEVPGNKLSFLESNYKYFYNTAKNGKFINTLSNGNILTNFQQ